MKWLEMLFPYRTHLEAEIEYLHQQLAQHQRRRDELEAVLVDIAKPQPKVQFERQKDGKLVKVQPRGWDAFRAYQRSQTSQVQSEDLKEGQDARSDG